MVKALKRELPSVLAIYHIMHKRADTIGCVWLAYCINSLYSYSLARLWVSNPYPRFWRPIFYHLNYHRIFRTDGLNFTLSALLVYQRITSFQCQTQILVVLVPSRQQIKKGGTNEKIHSLCIL